MTTTEHSPAALPLPPAVSRCPRGQALLLSALSGLLLVGAFPHLDWGWLAWFALVPFLSTFPYLRMREAVQAGFVLGLVFFAGLWYWMAIFAEHVIGKPLGMVIWIGAALSQTVTVILFAAGVQILRQRPNPWAWRMGVPALWAVLEWARQFGVLGTNWGDLAYTQHAMLTILQTTKLTGVFGLSFLIVLVNVALTPAPRQQKFRVAVGGVALAALAFGITALHTERMRPTLVAAALQGNVNQDVKWTPQYAQQTLAVFGAQAQKAAARGAKLVVWPETGFPGYVSTDVTLRAQAAAIAAQNHEAMLIGSVDYDYAAHKNANALFLMNADGSLGGHYWKQRLVPFGEYVPYRNLLPFLGKLHLTIYDMEPGGAHQPPLEAGLPLGKIGTAICYDSTVGEIMRRQVAQGADLLAVSTDDTWFGRTAAARQHAACAAVRAAEDDRYLIRCAATGISQVIAPTGQILAEAPLFTQHVVSAPVQPRHDLTLYARWGDWWVAVCAGLLLLCLLPPKRLDRMKHQV